MLSTRVDLTEDRRFSGGNIRRIVPLEDVSSSLFIELADIRDREIMSTDEYEKLLRVEQFFGRKRHYTEVISVFHSDEHRFIEDLRTHCERCGKELKTPWNNFYGLCKECNDAISESEGDVRGKFPWSITLRTRDFRDEAINIFSMR